MKTLTEELQRRSIVQAITGGRTSSSIIQRRRNGGSPGVGSNRVGYVAP